MYGSFTGKKEIILTVPEESETLDLPDNLNQLS